MARYQNKFIDIDPEECSLEELKAAIDKLNELSGFYETKQLAIKLFLNSVYGATASKYFVGHNVDVAESITLQGQDLNHFSENSVNKYFRGIFQSEEEYNKIIYVPLFDYIERYPLIESLEYYAKNADKEWVKANLPIALEDIMHKKYSDEIKSMLKKVFIKTTFGQLIGIPYEKVKNFTINSGRLTKQKLLTDKEFADKFAYMGKTSYLDDDPTVSMIVAGDTDSISHDAEVYLDGTKQQVDKIFNQLKYENHDVVLKLDNGQELVPVYNHTTLAFNPNTPLQPKSADIKYIMRHKVSKAKYKIKSVNGKEVIVTGDHSCMVYRDGQVISIKAKDINPKTDKLVVIQ